MVNLRQRTPAANKSKVTKRTSSRVNNEQKDVKKYEEISIDSDDIEEDILLDSESESESESEEQASSVSDILENYVSSSSTVSVEDSEASEDDKEIRRIIEKTEAETRNIPLTARQRAKLEGTGPEDHTNEDISLRPNETALTDEQALKKSEKSRRRKLQRDAKIEETKRATIDRLLQKQKKAPASSEEVTEIEQNESRSNEDDSKLLQPGYMRFIEKNDCTLLQFPDDSTFQSAISDMTRPPKLCTDSLCQVCEKIHSKYVHPRNGKLFCSVGCYKLIK